MNKQLESRITTMKHRLEAGGKAIKDHARHARTRGAMLRVAIVDDHQLVRAGFRELLGEEVDLRIAFEAASGEEALEALQNEACDVLLLDLSLPGKSGVAGDDQL